ncbi:MAG: radical SAM protein [Planctomycetes bacterium]|nr:radical SAM protein [Planctomycetota bacterium]
MDEALRPRGVTTQVGAALITYFLPCRPGAIYVNVTDHCLNDCRFCIRRDGPMFFGQDLALRDAYPDADTIVRALTAVTGWGTEVREVVFCGMGEPLLRYACVLAVCKAIRAMPQLGVKIRIDTSGMHWAGLKHLDLLDYIDVLSVSLNAENAKKYDELCQPQIPNAFGVLMNFLNAVKCYEEDLRARGLHYPEVRLSVVDTSEESFIPASGREAYGKGCFPVPDLAACKRIASDFGWSLVVKRLFRDSRDERWIARSIEALCLRGPRPEACAGCSYRH